MKVPLNALGFCLANLFINSLAYGQPLEDTLRQRFDTFLQAGSDRNLTGFSHVVSRRNLNTTDNFLASTGREMGAEHLDTVGHTLPALDQAQIVQTMVEGATAGLVLKTEAIHPLRQPAEEPMVTFLFIRFVQEDESWKVDHVHTYSKPQFTESGAETIFDESWIPEDRAVNGKVEPAPDLLPVATIMGQVVVNCTGCTVKVSINGIEQISGGVAIVMGGLRDGLNTIAYSLYRGEASPFTQKLSVTLAVDASTTETVFSQDLRELEDGDYTATFEVTAPDPPFHFGDM
ncbi:MAG: hypothetical protein WD071_04900 [Pseudohongiella sp.]|uniref:hypothetical protein n=1 Tax=Pseudohongiella sp. TaxID=1979412 RepID=UPI0034A085A1